MSGASSGEPVVTPGRPGAGPSASEKSYLERLEKRVARHRLQFRGRPLWLLSVRVARRFVEVRVTGLAAEMTYYLILSLVPLVTALGAALGLLGDVLGPSSVRSMETALISAVEAVLSPELAAEVAVPLVEQLLRQEQVGLAIGSVAGALWLGSRVFRAAMRALGDAYQVDERRSLPALWGLSLVFTLAAVVVVALLLSLIVVGPLFGGGRWLADVLGAGEQFEQAWNVGRWPLVLSVCVIFLAWLYRVGQTADDSWRDALPGALLATVTLVALAAAFRLYVDAAGPQGPDISSESDVMAVVGRFIGTALATMLFGWLGSIVVLMGGVFNAEWNHVPRS